MSEVLTNLDAALSAFSEFAAPLEQRPIAAVADFARLDLDRQTRTGRPEVIYAAGKTPAQGALLSIGAGLVVWLSCEANFADAVLPPQLAGLGA